MAEANAEGAPKPKKKLLMFIVIGVVALVILLGGGLAAFLMLRSDPTADEIVAESGHGGEAKVAKKEESGHPPVFEKLPLFTVNLISESGEVMQTEIVLELADAHAQETVKQLMPKIQGGVNKMLSSKTPEEIKTPAGRDKLEVEVKELVNQIVNEEAVLSVNFTSFIVR